MPHMSARTDVVVVGAGPVGLTLSLLLRQYGLTVRVLEAHPNLSKHPKARGISASSMETFRGIGVEALIREVSLPAEHVRFFRGESLSDPCAELTGGPSGGASSRRWSPSPGALCSQDRLEPVLAEAANAAGVDVRFGARVIEVRDSGDTVAIEASCGGVRQRYTADWVVGCDGAKSLVRETARVTLSGDTGLGHFLSVRFRAPLGPVVAGKEATSYFLSGGRGGFLAIDNENDWIYQYPGSSEDDLRRLEADAAGLVAVLRDAAGVADLEIEVTDTMLWRMDARVASSFRQGRLLLAGDSAHQTPPTGGHGMNVGIADAAALAWRLAAVTRGCAEQAALDDYSRERRSIAAAVIRRSLDNSKTTYGIDDELLLGVGVAPAPALAGGSYQPASAPGRRLAHAWLSDDELESVLDRDWGRLRLLVVAGGQPDWAAAWICATVGLPQEMAAAAVVPVESRVAAAIGISAGEALLVRPDGHIASRYSEGRLGARAWLEARVSEVLSRGSMTAAGASR